MSFNLQSIRSLFFIFLLSPLSLFSQVGKHEGVYSGISWFDDRGKVLSAHGANIVLDGSKFYMFGEVHTDTSNVFAGFSCYSSTDLYNWKYESMALSAQTSGKLGPNRVGERPKVMKCPSTGEYVMYMHVDTLGYKDQFVGYATSSSVSGPYIFRGPLLFNGNPIKKWDMGTFQDQDGAGYILIHGGEIYRLSDDYRSVVQQVNKTMTSGFESPAIFRKGDMYYFLGSHLTSWEKNDNYYYTATSLAGPWTARGIFAPAGSLTWNSQTTFVLPVKGTKETSYIFMGDRWSYPKQASAATYVWQPLAVEGESLSIPEFKQGWKINVGSGEMKDGTLTGKVLESDSKVVNYKGNWKYDLSDGVSVTGSEDKGSSIFIPVEATQIGAYFLAGPTGGYARVRLADKKGKVLLESIVDLYCKYPVSDLKFLSPKMPKGTYTLSVSVLGERPNWSDKRKSDYGSTGYLVALDKVIIVK